MSKKTLREQLSVDVDDVLDWVLREKIEDKASFLDNLAEIFEDTNMPEFVRHNALAAFQVVAPNVAMPNMSSLVQRLIRLSKDPGESEGLQSAARSARASCHWDKTTA